jgi:nucleotide-binding universal stress UspA family protein
MFTNVLIAYDGSEHSQKGVQIANELARQQQPSPILWILTVMDATPWEMGEPYLTQLIEERTTTGEDLLKEASEMIGEGLEIHTELLFGTPAEGIIQVAKTHSCDLIIMGTRGMGLLEGLLLGSQAQKVINHAHCPVLVVK